MFGIKYIKFDSMTYVIHYKNGKISKEGKGLSFFYFAPNSSITAISLGSNDLPFIFNESTADYQAVSIQGQVTYKINEPNKLAEILDYTVDAKGLYKKDNSEKLNQRIINESQTATTAFIQGLSLKEAIRSTKEIESRIREGLKNSDVIALLGIEIIGINILAVKASPEMERALETETREKLQQEADQAIYERRNFAVEQEQKIKESELNTEIAVEEKKKQITEKKMEAKVLQAENERQLREMNIQADISVEEQKQKLIDVKIENEKKEADSKGYTIDANLKPYKDLDWKTILAITGSGDSKTNIALAFRELAENAQKVGNVNISPDLLNSLLSENEQQY